MEPGVSETRKLPTAAELAVDTPYPFTYVSRHATHYCSRCGKNSEKVAATDLTAIWHQKTGRRQWMNYCATHLPQGAWQTAAPVVVVPEPEEIRPPVCPNCFVQVPYSTRWCDHCEQSVV